MAQPFPYTYYACDCYESRFQSPLAKRNSRAPAEDEEERTFDPSNPRSNYSLFPLEHLLYCEDCRQIRCPRCVVEETLNWFCPSCLFEVPSSVVKSDGNRCTRNCYNCPVCTAPMTVSSLEDPADPSPSGGPYILSCPYCHWSTEEIGIEFEKPTGITGQLAKIANGGKPMQTQKERDKERERRKEAERARRQDRLTGSGDEPPQSNTGSPPHDDVFASLSSFYKSQLAAQTPSNPFSHDVSFTSPSSFSRIMNLYSNPKKQKRDKPTPMREAASALEGLTLHDPTVDTATIERLKTCGWSSTLSSTQQLAQPPGAHFTSSLRPIATLLHTKRGKRCATCRHILSKPESKITSTRYKIKLLALNHIPRLSLRYLSPLPITPNHPVPQTPNPANFSYDNITSGLPIHFLLHLSNPLFDPIRVTLATPSTTPGKIASAVTILCPQFDVGANTDVWDDALGVDPPRSGSVTSASDGQIEAGKVWDRGRNWTSVVIEIVPGFKKSVTSGWKVPGAGGERERGEGSAEQGDDLDEDDDVLEIPIFVRIEFETDVLGEERGEERGGAKEGLKEKREEAFWTVVGVGRIAG
ncbi:hypothetical protein M011DRAFT_470106 [Sporormia fimetaria CBS 119925]|uniref:Dynactin subunit 4 n=1 Tax=Sporormia fimetaria CBS 119925 TaxID=1340428 RepID=A0A6A6V6F2_9PLEO|nr:hypothetical protein M011DRAFT_470106 [Sporormia fimetaria CBS 119925]